MPYKAVLVVLLTSFFVVGIYFVKPIFDGSRKDVPVPEVEGDHLNRASAVERSASDDLEEFVEVSTASGLIMDQGSSPSPVERALNFELSIVEGADQMALDGRWSYDEKIKNLALWEGLCLASDNEVSRVLGQAADPDELRDNLRKLCAKFSSESSEIDDLLEVEIEERELGTNDRADLETSLDDSGPDAATVFAISELSRALESLDYARTLEVVWFLGTYSFQGASEEFTVYRRQPRVETMFAVSAALFCNYIGGCRGRHPIALNLCFQFPDRPCSRYPKDIYDAVEQILTGYELETFNYMNNALVRLLNRQSILQAG